MKKRIITFLISSVLILTAVIPAAAATDHSDTDFRYLVDDAFLLSENERHEISARNEKISKNYGYDLVVLTADTTGSYSLENYADDFYEEKSYTSDGIVLLIDNYSGEYLIRGYGMFEEKLNEAALTYIEEQILPSLRDEDFAKAFNTFADVCEEMFELSLAGKEFRKPFGWISGTLLALSIGLVLSFIITSCMKGQLKNVQNQFRAENYIRTDSMKITQSSDIFLYHHITRTAKPKSGSNGGRSGGGSSRGGSRSGSFR